MDRLESVKKKKKDNSTSDVDMQFKSINLLADRLGEDNAFANEEFSSEPSSFSGPDQALSDNEFFKDIMKYKDDMHFNDSKVRPIQNLYNISNILSKEMEFESRHKSRAKSRMSVAVNSVSDSKMNLSKQSSLLAFHAPTTPIQSSNLKPKSNFPSPIPKTGSGMHRKSISAMTTPRSSAKK